MKKILLITPPFQNFTQVNGATGYLKGYIGSKNNPIDTINLCHTFNQIIYSKKGAELFYEEAEFNIKNDLLIEKEKPENILLFKDLLINNIELAVKISQHKSLDINEYEDLPTLAFPLPNASKFSFAATYKQIQKNYKQPSLNKIDYQKALEKFYYDQSIRFLHFYRMLIASYIDDFFEWESLDRYNLAINSYQDLEKRFNKKETYLDKVYTKIVEDKILSLDYDIIGISIPYMGNLFHAFLTAKLIKIHKKKCKVVFGGSFVSTSMREHINKQTFDYIDYLVLDTGELPLENIIKYEEGVIAKEELIRTYMITEDQVRYMDNGHFKLHHSKKIIDYTDLKYSEYLSPQYEPQTKLKLVAPLKFILSFGCYWRRCTFCDVELDYVKRYELASVDYTIEQIERLIKDTGNTCFHFVDEAIPPAFIKVLCKELNKRDIKISWFGNIRFEKAFTRELVELMASSGCFFVSGGIEAASDRILKLMDKGVDLETAAKVTSRLRQNNVLVHAYLIYNFPSQTPSELMSGLEYVRQLFLNDCLTSAHWNRFLVTPHNLVYKSPEKFGVKLMEQAKTEDRIFEFEYPYSYYLNPELSCLDYGVGLKNSALAYMNKQDLEKPISSWFEKTVSNIAQAELDKDFVKKVIESDS